MGASLACEWRPDTWDEDRYRPGDEIGTSYVLLRKAGEGAMGAVWIALNTALDLRVAIKLVHPRHHDPMVSERLVREAALTAKVSHPGVVRVFDCGHTAVGDPYLVMELLRGQTLRDVLDREAPLAPERAVQMILPAVAGMDAAHQHGIVHRDLKPDNIMLARDDAGRLTPKVIDFGIAMIHWPEERMETSGFGIVGTPDYMPPEQVFGLDEVDHRADVWSLCATLYESVACEPPFPRDSLGATLNAVIAAPTPSLVDNAGVDAELARIVEKGLRKDPCERWASMRELGEALAEWLLSRGVREDVSGASVDAQWLASRDGRTSLPAQAPLPVEPAATLAIPLVRRAPVGSRATLPIPLLQPLLEQMSEPEPTSRTTKRRIRRRARSERRLAAVSTSRAAPPPGAASRSPRAGRRA